MNNSITDAMEYAILVVSGKDGAGMGAQASCYLQESGANILEEYGRGFAPEYGMELFRFEATPDRMEDIEKSAKTVLGDTLNPIIRRIQKPPEDGYEPFIYVFEVVAVDKPGIIAKIEGSIAELGINIRQVEGRRKKLSGTGKAIYTGSFLVKIPPESLLPMRQLVEKFGREEHWDIDLRPEKSWYGTNNLVPLFVETMTTITCVDPPSRR